MEKVNTHMGARKLPLIEKPVLAQSREACKVNSQLSRYSSVDSGSSWLRQPHNRNTLYRRRSLAETNLRPYFKRQNTFREDVGHAASETYLITSLSFKLLRYLGLGYRWLLKLAALFLYAWFLMPGFIQVGWYYFFSHHVHRSIVYGGEPRNRMDLYFPDGMEEELKPVLIFVTGGAWIIGYKAWGSLLGKLFVERGVIVVCLDYRNFPQGTISDMVKDVSQGVSYVFSNIAHFGGDPSRVFLAGQSAGAHIAACVLVEQARKELIENASDLSWRASQLKAFFGISGGYDLVKLVDHFHERGLYRSIFHSIMDGEDSLSHFSPERVVKSLNPTDATSLLPPIHLYHGMADCSIPCDASTSFAETLTTLGVQAQIKLYPKKTHTDLFLQDPLRGGRDELVVDILAVVHDGDEDAQASDALAPPQRRLVPEIFLQLARAVSPF